MMKHVQMSMYYRSKSAAGADTVSLSSTTSYGSLSRESLGSRSSSYSSLNNDNSNVANNNEPTTIIKIYAKCLRPDIEYKTLAVSGQTTSREIVNTLLSKFKMKHRDPKLFFLSMEVMVRKAGVRTQLALDDEARPVVLQSCHPKGDSRISLQMRRGGLVKVYDGIINSHSQYKSLLISARTTSDDLLSLLLNCSASKERVEHFSLYEVDAECEQQRKLHPDDRPLLVQQSWLARMQQSQRHFLVRRNFEYVPPPPLAATRRKLLWLPDAGDTSGANCRQWTQTLPKSKTISEAKIKDVLLKSTDLKIFQRSSVVGRALPPGVTLAKAASTPFVDYENYFYI